MIKNFTLHQSSEKQVTGTEIQCDLLSNNEAVGLKKNTINNILAYSKALQIKPLNNIGDQEIVLN